MSHIETIIEAANEKLAGMRIVRVRAMTQTEAEGLGWDQKAIVIELTHGLLFASQDDEGNGPGAMFGDTETGDITLPVIR